MSLQRHLQRLARDREARAATELQNGVMSGNGRLHRDKAVIVLREQTHRDDVTELGKDVSNHAVALLAVEVVHVKVRALGTTCRGASACGLGIRCCSAAA